MFSKSKSIKSWSQSVSHAGIMNQIALALTVAVIVLIFMVMSKKETVIVVPPTFNEEITFVGNQASEAYKTGWGLFTANLAGNISERNQAFVVDTLRKMFRAKDADNFEHQLQAQVDALKVRGVRESFTSLDLIYNSDVDLVWVYGDKKTVSTRTGASTTQKWTYEIRITASNGMPKIDHFSQYSGAPETRSRVKAIKEANADKVEKQEGEQLKPDDLDVPLPDDSIKDNK
ncbi:TraE/TraK family type IV conjugative transfer system protein [Photobacterium toruni]|uniref:TraE/TraK family type IV conjugative transfer system protein n=1 Tax=Photobacterium toruni TaxID=1935446 RepID=UPI00211039E2|nr:TraE/TraK family type IV conjugative transfer system protein [Photobacterium toruni]